jgi:tetratricopeptide (TPR) repeat protein
MENKKSILLCIKETRFISRLSLIALLITAGVTTLIIDDVLAWTAGSTGWCTDASGRNYRCSDGPPSSGGGGGGGGGGGNAAANAQAAIDAFNWGLTQGQVMMEAMRQNTLRQATSYNNQGVAYAEQGDIDAALRCYELAAKLNRDDPVIQNNLRKARGRKADNTGHEYVSLQKWDLAIKSFQEAIDFDDQEEYRSDLEDALKWKKQDEPRLKQIQELDKSKDKVSSKLGELSSELRIVKAPADTELDFVGAAVDLRQPGQQKLPVIDPKKVSGNWSGQKFEALKTGISSEIYPECKDKSLDCAARTELILDAVQEGNGNWGKSVIFLEREAQKRGGATPMYQQAISYMEGFQYYEEWSQEAMKKVKPPTSQNPIDGAESLVDDFWKESKSGWPGPKRQVSAFLGGQPAMVNPDNWKLKRAELIIKTLDENKNNLNAAIRQLEKKVKDNPKDNVAINTLNFFRGWQGYFGLAQDYQAKKTK